MHCELYYWPSLPGRGEIIRLALEEGGATYDDVCRKSAEDGGGVPALMRILKGEEAGVLPFAPPIVRVDGRLIAQTANILQHLAPRLGLVPDDEASRLYANQLMLTLGDLLDEVHDVHHPIAGSLYYEDQKVEAKRRAQIFVSERLPKMLSFFERVLERSGGEWLVGKKSYVDLAMFQILSGLQYAFPRATGRIAASVPLLQALRERVAALPRIAAFLKSDRHVAFNETGIFRHYPELDH